MLSLNDLKKNIFKNIGIDKIVIIVAVGILLVVISIPTKKSQGDITSQNTVSALANNDNSSANMDYEEYLETKIKKMLSKVDGVGKVEVMVTLKGTSEKILVSENNYSENNIDETDSDGGVRKSEEKSQSQSYLYSDSGNGSQPYVAQEIKPEVEGVIIIAQGGADSVVATNVTKAIEALLSVPVHKIQVLKMSN